MAKINSFIATYTDTFQELDIPVGEGLPTTFTLYTAPNIPNSIYITFQHILFYMRNNPIAIEKH